MSIKSLTKKEIDNLSDDEFKKLYAEFCDQYAEHMAKGMVKV